QTDRIPFIFTAFTMPVIFSILNSRRSNQFHQGAAAVWTSAVARKFVFELFGNWFVEFQGVIVEKFFTRLDVSQRINKNAAIFLNRFAVRVAGMVDPARVVATNAR